MCVQDQVLYNLQIFIIINANWCYTIYSQEKCSALLLFFFICVCVQDQVLYNLQIFIIITITMLLMII